MSRALQLVQSRAALDANGWIEPVMQAVREFYRVQAEKGLTAREAVSVFDALKANPTAAMLRDYASKYGHLPFDVGRELYTNQLHLVEASA